MWGYSAASSNPNKAPEPEDVSHGAEDVRFAVVAAQNSIVFTRDDLDRFSKAYLRYRNQVKKPVERDALDRWIFLSWESCTVYQATYPDLITRTGRQDAEVLLAVAGLARYSDRCGTYRCAIELSPRNEVSHPNQYFVPEIGAAQTRLLAMAKQLHSRKVTRSKLSLRCRITRKGASAQVTTKSSTGWIDGKASRLIGCGFLLPPRRQQTLIELFVLFPSRLSGLY